ncbi:MAG: hypothetical protein RL129_501, partial [Actinomycetota bacterium]
LSYERCGQIGATLAAFCLETKGTQEYRFDKTEFTKRLATSFGQASAAEVSANF